jgi:hypothetical protein
LFDGEKMSSGLFVPDDFDLGCVEGGCQAVASQANAIHAQKCQNPSNQLEGLRAIVAIWMSVLRRNAEIEIELENHSNQSEQLRTTLRTLLDAMSSTTVYSGVRYGKSKLAKAWNDAEKVLKETL